MLVESARCSASNSRFQAIENLDVAADATQIAPTHEFSENLARRWSRFALATQDSSLAHLPNPDVSDAQAERGDRVRSLATPY